MLNPDINYRQIENYVIFYSQFEITIQNYRLNVRTTLEMTYEKFINNILETRGRFNCGDEYHERHHIVPKCMGGTNDEENLIDLFAREHFEAHRLLALENPENEKLVYAWWMMAHMNNANQREYEITADEYEEVKNDFSQLASKNAKQYVGSKNPNYGNHKLSGENNPMYGKRGELSPHYGKPKSEEHKRKIGLAHKGKKESEDSKRKNSESHKGIRRSKESIEKQRRSISGENNYQANKVCQYDISGSLIKIYGYLKLASEQTGISRGGITDCCRKRHKTAGGFVWYYLYDQTRKDGTIIPGAITLGLITEEEALMMLEEQKEKTEE